MSKQTEAIRDDLGQLAEDARALVAATLGVGGEEVNQARNRLAATLDNGRNIFDRIRARTVEGAQTTNRAVHLHPYHAMGIAFAMGTLVGVLGDLLAHQVFRNRP